MHAKRRMKICLARCRFGMEEKDLEESFLEENESEEKRLVQVRNP